MSANQPCGNTVAERNYDGGGDMSRDEQHKLRVRILESKSWIQNFGEIVCDEITNEQWAVIGYYLFSPKPDYCAAGHFLHELMQARGEKLISNISDVETEMND